MPEPLAQQVGQANVGHVGPVQARRTTATGATSTGASTTSSPNDLEPPGGWERLTDALSGMEVFFNSATGKLVYDRLDCYKKPPPSPATAKSAPSDGMEDCDKKPPAKATPAETPTQPGFVTPEVVILLAPRRPKKIRKINPGSPIDLCSCSSGEEESPEIVYGNTEAQGAPDGPINKHPMDIESESDSLEKTAW